MSNAVIIAIVLVAGVLIILVFDAAGRFIASLGGTCLLKKSVLLKDACVGGCPATQSCVAITVRRYFIFSTQAVTCACVPTTAGGTPTSPPPGVIPVTPIPGSPGSGGSGAGGNDDD